LTESEKIGRIGPYPRQPRPDIKGHDNRYAASGDLLPELQYCKPDPTFFSSKTKYFTGLFKRCIF